MTIAFPMKDVPQASYWIRKNENLHANIIIQNYKKMNQDYWNWIKKKNQGQKYHICILKVHYYSMNVSS
jgi:hypothetical protein